MSVIDFTLDKYGEVRIITDTKDVGMMAAFIEEALNIPHDPDVNELKLWSLKEDFSYFSNYIAIKRYGKDIYIEDLLNNRVIIDDFDSFLDVVSKYYEISDINKKSDLLAKLFIENANGIDIYYGCFHDGLRPLGRNLKSIVLAEFIGELYREGIRGEVNVIRTLIEDVKNNKTGNLNYNQEYNIYFNKSVVALISPKNDVWNFDNLIGLGGVYKKEDFLSELAVLCSHFKE